MEQVEAELLYEIGETAQTNGDILEAEEHLHKALEAFQKLANPRVRVLSPASPPGMMTGQGLRTIHTSRLQFIARVQYQLGRSSVASHRPFRAARFFSEQLKTLVSTNDREEVAKGSLEMGKILKATDYPGLHFSPLNAQEALL